MTVLVTGANGFVGSALCAILRSRDVPVRCAVRRENAQSTEAVAVGEIGFGTDWTQALEGVEAIVHLAARVHVMDDDAKDSLAAFRAVNVAGTVTLARQAAHAGVRRFVYVSTVKVLGETSRGRPFHAEDPAAPEDAYAVSKWEAEQALKAVAAETDLEVVIVRPPLVYGPGARGNFARLVRMVARGVPLPLKGICNRRSLVALDNLVDLLIRCIEHPAGPGESFLVSDGEDLSTPDLIRRLADAMGRRARLFPVPVPVLRLVGRLSGRAAEIERLVGSLQVDIGHTCSVLDWRPPVSVDEGLRRAVG